MRPPPSSAIGALAAVTTLGAAIAAGGVCGQPSSGGAGATPAAQLSPAATSASEQGRYLAALGDCVACHTAKGGAPFAGGRPLQTPFGTILSANITPDHDTGIGSWTADQFYRALHRGIDDEGHHLYPAFPYNYYTRVDRADSDAIFAYLKTVPPVRNAPRRDQLPFPFNIRTVMILWNWLFLRPGEYRPNPAKPSAWNRGAYLVEGLGHCGACHTGTNLFGAPKTSAYLQGGKFGDWFAPDLTPNPRKGLGGWSRADLIRFLKTGGNAHAAASAEMGEVVDFSTSLAAPADLEAIAAYLADLPASPPATGSAPPAGQLQAGEAIYADSCSACHRAGGEGVPGVFPPLKGDANLQQANPLTTLHFILTGVQSTPTAARPTGLSMPAYAWKLDNQQVAAVATYVRNAWGNRAPAISDGQVASLRRRLVRPAGQLAAPERSGVLSGPTPTTLAPAYTDSRDNGTSDAGRAAGSGSAGGGGSGPSNGEAKSHETGDSQASGPG